MNRLVNILVVDDSEVARDHICRMLEAAPIETRVGTACSLETGLASLREQRFDCVLLDFWLPDGDSFQFMDRARADGHLNAPVLILTAQDDDETAVNTVRCGAEDYLVKGGFDSSLLARAIRYAIERDRIKRELDAAKNHLERLSLVDPLTQALNRRGLQQALLRESQLAKRVGTDVVAILVDLDNFKSINDRGGYTGGDIVLTEVARRLTAALRTSDYVCRVGGDEFLALLPDTGLAEGVQVGEKIRAAISGTPITIEHDRSLQVTASLGVVNVGTGTLSVDVLLAMAQDYTRTSKDCGKNRVSSSSTQGGRGDSVPDALKEVLAALRDGNKYQVVVQPIVQLADRQVAGCELCTRLPIAQFEMPADFLSIARDAKMTTSVDCDCFARCIERSRALPRERRCHVNLLPTTLCNTAVDHLLQIIERSGHGGSYCIELSEPQIVGDPMALVTAVRALRAAGVLVAIDDVGNGRSCLETLIVLEPDIVKIDKRFVSGFARDEVRTRSLQRLVKLLRSLGALIIAEGVVSAEDTTALIDLGIRFGQGDHLAQPEPLDATT